MKDFFEDLSKRIGETAEAMTNKAGEAVEIQRLKNQIRSLERENEKDFAEIGKRIYRLYQKNNIIDETAAGYCEAIKSREGSIREYHHKMAKVRGAVKCHTCGKMVEKEMAFCPYCGAKAEEAEDMAEQTVKKAADAVDKAAQKTADAVDKAAQKTADVVDKASQKTADTVEKVARKTADAADKAAEKTADMADKAAEKTADMTHKAAEKVADMAEKVAEKASDIAEKAEEKTEK